MTGAPTRGVPRATTQTVAAPTVTTSERASFLNTLRQPQEEHGDAKGKNQDLRSGLVKAGTRHGRDEDPEREAENRRHQRGYHQTNFVDVQQHPGETGGRIVVQ